MNDKIKSKLQKLKALAEDSCNEHESVVAQRLLDKLAKQHGVTLEQLQLDEDEHKLCQKFGFHSVRVDSSSTGTTVTVEASHDSLGEAIGYSIYEALRQRKLKRKADHLPTLQLPADLGVVTYQRSSE